jgi:hypothetical protein
VERFSIHPKQNFTALVKRGEGLFFHLTIFAA